MPELIEALGIDRMQSSQRRQLIREMRVAFPEDVEVIEDSAEGLPEDWKLEVERRLASHRANPGLAQDWRDVHREILAELDQ